MMEFHKSNVEDGWWDLINEFPEFILELSPTVQEWYQESLLLESGKNCMPNCREDLINLRYSFECGLGWKSIIWEYFTNIRKLIDDAKSNGDDINYKTCIFKEKFGRLCDQGDFYGADRLIYWSRYCDLSRSLGIKSSITCEVCGITGHIRERRWARCLCDGHAD